MRRRPMAHCEQLGELELSEGREGTKRREGDFMLTKLGAIVSGLVAGRISVLSVFPTLDPQLLGADVV